ncbi:MAG: winged helix-turn-helix domain-containing protein [Nitrosomonadales bacterium]|nr:winged helix-turn-helix domain-containing protein [Nitrosomonadales bacterium]
MLRINHKHNQNGVTASNAENLRLETWQLSEILGKDDELLSKSSLEVRVVRLRKKLSQVYGGVSHIKSIRLYGYQLCVSLRLH